NLLRLRGARRFGEPLLELREERIDGHSSGRAEEVDGAEVGEPPAQPQNLALGFGPALGRKRAVPLELGAEGAKLRSDLRVGLVAHPNEETAALLIAEPDDEIGLADHPLAAALLDLTQQPLEILERLLARRQDIDRVLDRDRAQPLQPTPD